MKLPKFPKRISLEILPVPIIDVKKDMEENTRDFLEREGYEVERASDMKWKVDKELFWETGVPDFYVRNDHESFFVEVKDFDDALRLPQILWILKHIEYKVILAIPKQAQLPYVPW